jgi:hypothetical protein
MNVPPEELPDVKKIEQWVLEGLPKHYVLRRVYCTYGTDWPAASPEDWELRIEYENHTDEALKGTIEHIEVHHAWADPLRERIRAEWSPWALRVVFDERLPQTGEELAE